MRFKNNVDLGITILYTVLTVVFVFGTIWCFGFSNLMMDFIGGSSGGTVDSNDPGAGYIMIAKILGGGAGLFAGVAMFLLGIFCAFLALLEGLFTVVAWNRRKRYKATGDVMCIQKNLKEKMFLNTICLVLGIINLLSEMDTFTVIIVLVSIGLEVLIVLSLSKQRDKLY